jgi:transcriptional regulator with XRE-family HTH domain
MDHEEKLRFAGRLRDCRVWAGCSEEESAAAAGVPRSAYRAWERGTTMPSLFQFRDLMSRFGTNGYQVLHGSYPFQFTKAEARELQLAAKSFSPGLRSRVDILMALLAEPGQDPQGRRADAAATPGPT